MLNFKIFSLLLNAKHLESVNMMADLVVGRVGRAAAIRLKMKSSEASFQFKMFHECQAFVCKADNG